MRSLMWRPASRPPTCSPEPRRRRKPRRRWLAGLFLAVTAACSTPQPAASPYDVLITNAQIVDGSGSAARRGSVAITAGKIAAVGDVGGTATRTIDARGRTLAPGFIDLHSHSDMTLLTDGNGQSKIRQGVTTEVIGESGSVAPRKPTVATGGGEQRTSPCSPCEYHQGELSSHQ